MQKRIVFLIIVTFLCSHSKDVVGSVSFYSGQNVTLFKIILDYNGTIECTTEHGDPLLCIRGTKLLKECEHLQYPVEIIQSNGSLSAVLMNVTINHSGLYKCNYMKTLPNGTKSEDVWTINLIDQGSSTNSPDLHDNAEVSTSRPTVPEPGSFTIHHNKANDTGHKSEKTTGWLLGIGVLFILVCFFLFLFWFCNRR